MVLLVIQVQKVNNKLFQHMYNMLFLRSLFKKGGKGDVGPEGLKGDKGLEGSKGEDGLKGKNKLF